MGIETTVTRLRLDDIGFYTLTEERARNISLSSPLVRCEMILTDNCNLRCVYCRGLDSSISGDMPLDKAQEVIGLWLEHGLQNIRFSGGEPTLYPSLVKLARMARDNGVKRIAVSTNGTRSIAYYEELIKAGVNDFSISLDGACCAIGDAMAGGISGTWDKAVNAIREISKQVYCTVGMVFTEANVNQAMESVLFVDSLGVADIRVIPSAQYNKALTVLSGLPDDILAKYPILSYRINNLRMGHHVRGLSATDSQQCYLVLDDMAVAGDYHYPCIIYLREGGSPIGRIGLRMRQERAMWSNKHNCHEDAICQTNCLDVCVGFNNSVDQYVHNTCG